jgi:hypothetical protein
MVPDAVVLPRLWLRHDDALAAGEDVTLTSSQPTPTRQSPSQLATRGGVRDVFFVTARAVVLIHRDRGEHIVRELGGALQQPVLALPERQVSPAAPLLRQSTVPDPGAAITTLLPRYRLAYGWLGIFAAAAVFVGVLAVPLDDSGAGGGSDARHAGQSHDPRR